MKFARIPNQHLHIGAVIDVNGTPMIIESYSHTGKNVVAHSMPDAKRFERTLCIVGDFEPITEIPA